MNFAPDTHRRIMAAHEILYKTPTMHPNRPCPPFHDFVYFCDGEWDIVLYGEKYTFHKGDVMVLPAGAAHYSERVCSAMTRTYFIHAEPLKEDDGALFVPPIIHAQGYDAPCALFEEIVGVYHSSAPSRECVMSALMGALICLLNRAATKKDAHSAADDAIALMREESGVFFTEAQMARRLFISDKTLRKCFTERFGKTFYKYQLDYKLSIVCTLLLNAPDMKLREIAADVGFCDEFHLSRVFKAKYAVTPSEYRRK